MSNKFRVSITGCGLGDFVYNHVDFESEKFNNYKSVSSGDGGLEPGKLVFKEELEKYVEKKISSILEDIVGTKSYDHFNIGGPALVSAINIKQLLCKENVEISYYGALGNDNKGKKISDLLRKLDFDLNHFIVFPQETPYTDVLSDPDYDFGKGERIFINDLGCAAEYNSNYLDESFWTSEVIVFGGTALVPCLHADLTQLLQKAKERKAFTVVHTVYDFINEKLNPHLPWPLGNTSQSLPLIDLLIMDFEEAKRISGCTNFEKTCMYFKENGANAFIITHGANPSYIYSSGDQFYAIELNIPVCSWISSELALNPQYIGDTTGCGDNFTGAVIASIVKQKITGQKYLSLCRAAIFGTASGGFTCYYLGGTYFEQKPGEKLDLVNEMYNRYLSLQPDDEIKVYL